MQRLLASYVRARCITFSQASPKRKTCIVSVELHRSGNPACFWRTACASRMCDRSPEGMAIWSIGLFLYFPILLFDCS